MASGNNNHEISSSSSTLEKLLQRLARHFSSSARPPDAASDRLGREVARCAQSLKDLDLVFKSLVRAAEASRLPPSLPYAVMDEITDRMRGDLVLHDFEFLGTWLHQTERPYAEAAPGGTTALRHLLTACVRAYSVYLVTQNENLHYSAQQRQQVLDVYRRLELESTKSLLVQFVLEATSNLKILSPLLAASVLSSSAKHPVSFLHLFWRSLFESATTKAGDRGGGASVHRALVWMKAGLEIHLQVLTTSPRSAPDLTLAREWWTLLVGNPLGLDLAPLLFRLAPASARYGVGLPAATSASCCFPLRDATTAFRWTTMALATANARDRRHWMQLVLENVAGAAAAASKDATSHSGVAVSLLRAMAVIGSETEECSDVAVALADQVDRLNRRDATRGVKPTEGTECLIELLEQGGDSGLVRAMANRSFESPHPTLSESQQIASLLLGIVLLDQDESMGLAFLSNLLRSNPHLAITLLPIMLNRVQSASQKSDEQGLLRSLKFLCEVLARDVHCAVEIWNILTQLLSQNMPLAVRITTIRLLPSLVDSNRRMYQRVIDVLGAALSNRQAELRLAAAATLADLAQNDCIVDVSDVIGWIQSLLTESTTNPIHALVVHYAVMALHYLVVTGNLTFDIVIKVLNKRMLSSSVSNFDAVAALPPVVQEALVLLLGDGECDGASSDESEAGGRTSRSGGNQDKTAIVSVSPQVSSSVHVLIRLGMALQELRSKQPWDATQKRTVRNTYQSLAGYSLEALGLTEEGINSVMSYFDDGSSENMALTEAGERYISLRNLVVSGITCLDEEPVTISQNRGDTSHPDVSLVMLARKLVEFEEEIVGSKLWRKHGLKRQIPSSSASAKSSGSSRLERGITAVLPDPVVVHQIAAERTISPGAAIALLLSSDGTQLSVIRDNGDAALETTDPLFLVFLVQAYLHVSSNAMSRNRREDAGILIDEVESWSIFVSPDTMYLALSSLCIYLPFDLQEQASENCTYAQKVFHIVLEAYQSNRFEKDDVAKICLGLISVSSLRSGSLGDAALIVDLLEQSVKGYGGRQCFGAYYGLSLVCQALHQYLDSDVFRLIVPEARRLVFRICGFLIDEILTCYEERSDIFVNLVACVKSGVATSDLVESMSDLDAGSLGLLMTKQVKARYLFISCASCLPALSSLNGALHLATLRLMEAFEWGGGKGIALPPMLRACESANLFETDELKQIYASFAQTFEDRMDCREKGIDSDGLDDIFYAFNGTTSSPTTHIIRRTLVGNRDLFDDDGCVLSLIAMTVSVAPVPCLGSGYFTIPPDVRIDAMKSDVESIVEIVNDAASIEAEKYSEMALILMAFLASMKQERELGAVAFSLPAAADKGRHEKVRDTRGVGINFDKVPCPHAETTLAGILNHVESLDVRTAKRGYAMTIIMSVLESLSLPDAFSKSFIEPLMRVAKDSVARSCVNLLCSQLRGRRRAVFGDRDFVLLTLKLANTNVQDWSDMGSTLDAFQVFISSLGDIVKKIPPESSGIVLEKTWNICVSFIPGNPSLAVKFLISMSDLLDGVALAPKTSKSVRRHFEQIFTELPGSVSLSELLQSEDGTPSILDAFVGCLATISRNAVEDDSSFNFLQSFDGFDVEAFKVLAMIDLAEADCFDLSKTERRELGLSNAASWIAKKLHLSGDEVNLHSLRVVIHSFAVASTRDNASAKKERLSFFLDVLLQTKRGTSRLSVHWLAVVMAQWSVHSGSDELTTLGFLCIGDARLARNLSPRELEQLLEVMMYDLPYNLSGFASREKVSATVSKQLYRMHEVWSEQQVDPDVLECIRLSSFACHANTSNDEAFESLATYALASDLHV